MVKVSVEDWVGSAMEVAMILVDGLAGTVDGGRYVKLVVLEVTMLPQPGAHAVVVPAVTSCQLTPWALTSLVTVALSTMLESDPAIAVVMGLVMLTETAPVPTMVNEMVSKEVGVAMVVAVTMTTGFAGTVAGAV